MARLASITGNIPPMNTQPYQRSGNDYESLSFRDLLDARDAYHIHLMNHPHVIATAVGRYRIRSEDSWPDADGAVKHRGSGPRILGNSEVRPYSWPAILAFVDEWCDSEEFSKGGRYNPDQMVPRTLYMPDGRKVPVCVVLVEKVNESAPVTEEIRHPLNNIGGGNPVLAAVQGREHAATIACLVSDGHKTYALTNRHVAGETGEVLYSRLDGRNVPIGRSSAKQLTRLGFTEVYGDFSGKNVFLNLDAGLIDIDDLNAWTAQVRGIGTVGSLVDLSGSHLSLSLVGCRVVGVGALSGRMEGEISALFYRYKAVGGFEYLADFLIGPRSVGEAGGAGKRAKAQPRLLTRPGDSGSLWLLDPVETEKKPAKKNAGPAPEYHPFGLQWGAQVFAESGVTSFALATSLSNVCRLLDLDLVRGWNLDQTDTWGSIGHFSIATSVAACVTDVDLKDLMTKNAKLISPARDDILVSDFKGMGSDDFVQLADVPDMFWKPRVAHQGFTRALEGPNHFADMDQVRDDDGETLLHLTLDDAFIDPDKWNDFYTSVSDLLNGSPIRVEHRGLVPFRVWQIFNDMVRFVKAGKVSEFVCAAGVLTHYVADACQPLHISYLHDGDPEQAFDKPVNHHGVASTERTPLGSGVHSAYEDAMVNSHRAKILDGLAATPKVKAAELIGTGLEAAQGTIAMMRTVFERIPPKDIVQLYVEGIGDGVKPKQMAEDMWEKFGDATIAGMKDGAHLLAVLWQSAWVAGGADHTIPASAIKALTQQKVMKICQDQDFLPSLPINKIGAVIKQPI
jgi:hypothetical protein